MPYLETIEDMRGWVEQRQNGLIEDRLVLLTHPPTITYGARTPPAELPGHGDIPVIPVDRGGQATYHGPGQLVGYLVIDLHRRGPGDIVRWLENGLITALDSLGFTLIRRDTPPGGQSLVGVWTPDHRKIASIGMRIRRGVTSHGFSLNIDPDLSVYQSFVACGMPDVPMTALTELTGDVPSESTVRDAVAAALDAV
ncbi:lipoyl(octanoyl) transferase [Actinosynnema sp. ALI-1.44]|nr:lipoyl(octanoyl) transferase [Actinosynnema sp. ALI-1.44]